MYGSFFTSLEPAFSRLLHVFGIEVPVSIENALCCMNKTVQATATQSTSSERYAAMLKLGCTLP